MFLRVLPSLQGNAELGAEREWRLLDTLFSQPATVAAGCGAYIALMLLLAWQTAFRPFLALALAGVVVAAWRLDTIRDYRRHHPDGTACAGGKPGRYWEMRFAAGACATAGLWGLACLTVPVVGSAPFPIMAVALLQAGWLSGAAVRNAASPFVVYAQVLLSMGPAMVALAINPMPSLPFLSPFIAVQGFVALQLSRFQAGQMNRLMLSEARLEAANTQLRQLTATDALTGIANRRGFDAALATEWARAARDGVPLSLIAIDVDHFKAYNDCYGHPAGDECLRHVAGLVRRVLRRPTDLAARYGGEEFAILLPGTDQTGALHLAERLRGAMLHAALPHAGSALGCLTISMGVAEARPDITEDPQCLFERADRALYGAKQAGRNAIRFAGPVSVPASIAA